MTDELLTEDRVPLTKLAAALGVNRRTITRWVDSGYDGRRLESYRIGKKRFSSLPAAQAVYFGSEWAAKQRLS